MKKKLLSGILAFAMLFGMGPSVPQTVQAAEPEPIVLEKSTQGNPVAGFDENGDLLYAGDPAILVDGDTVYLYVGHDDARTGSSYTMPDYLCYSTKDLKEWKYEGVTMRMTDVSWADNVSAWASQVIKYKGKYYLLYCAERKVGGNGKCTAAAVSDSPTGPFKDVGILITPDMTDASAYGRRGSFGWEDIDPTAWIDSEGVDGDGTVYMAWGNTNPYMCELEIDGESVKVKDINGDGKISQGDTRADGDIWYQRNDIPSAPAGNGTGSVEFTEAPYLYRRQDENGKYFGPYYMFFAMHWREEMGYATTDDLHTNTWRYRGKVMEPTATSDTNHPAVFNFKGHTYFIYHNGSLAGGMGQRRVTCIEELTFKADGSINYIQETSTGLTGFAGKILDMNNKPVVHEAFQNSLQDSFFPIMNQPVHVGMDFETEDADMLWEIEEGKADKSRSDYVTIESYNKPGLYLMANSAHNVVLAHDHNGNAAATLQGITSESSAMTFRTLKGFAGEGVTFESVAYPGYYLTATENGGLTVSQNPEAKACTFKVAYGDVVGISAQKTKRSYEVGDAVGSDDIRVKVDYDDGTSKTVKTGFTVDMSAVNTSKAGTQKIRVSYTEEEAVKTAEITITVKEALKEDITDIDINPVKDVPKKNSTHTVGNLKYKVTRTDGYNTDGSNGEVTVTGMKANKTSVSIPATITLDGYTFKVTAINSKAFRNKSKLKTITIGDNVKKIGNYAISGIHKKATIKVSSSRLSAVKKLLKAKTGFRKTMKVRKK